MSVGKWVSDCLKKTKYPNKGLALKVKADAEAKRQTPLRVYYCTYCNGYHLTKKAVKQNANG